MALGPKLPKHYWNPNKVVRRYAVYYYHFVGDFSRQDTSGSTDQLARAFGNAAKHCAMSELIDGEYSQALVIDRKRNRIIRSYRRNAGGSITVRAYDEK